MDDFVGFAQRGPSQLKDRREQYLPILALRGKQLPAKLKDRKKRRVWAPQLPYQCLDSHFSVS
jgi:hypothetical protein